MSKFILSGFADEIAKSLETQISVLKKLGISHIEMRGVNGKNITAHTLEEADEVKKVLDQNGISLSAIGSPLGKINIADDFEPHLAKLRHTIELAKILGAKNIRIFSFFMPQGEDPAKYRDEVFRRLEQMLKIAVQNDMVLLHENEKEIYGDNAERCLDILNQFFCQNFSGVFDPANFIQCGVEPYPYAYQLLKDKITYYHIKDAVAGTGVVVPSGSGDGRIYEMLKDVKAKGYEGYLSLEPHLVHFDGFAQLEKDAEKLEKMKAQAGTEAFITAANALKSILANINPDD